MICLFLSDQHAAGRRADPRSLRALGPHGREGATGGAQRYGWVRGGQLVLLSGEGREKGMAWPYGQPAAFGAPSFAFAAEWVWVKPGSLECNHHSGISSSFSWPVTCPRFGLLGLASGDTFYWGSG